MTTLYRFPFTEFPNSTVDASRLSNEVRNSDDIIIALDYINIISAQHYCDVVFKADLSDNEHVTLSGIVAAHSGLPLLEEPPTAVDGRPIIRSDSRPVGYSTMFTMTGDTTSGIGDGKEFFWDFSNDDDLVTDSGVVPAGYKMKRIRAMFLDPVYIKEGTNYFKGALKKSYVNFSIVCPQGQYYLQRDGSPAYAFNDVVMTNYVNKHFFSGDCSMGDELNTEGCADSALPSNYELWIEVYVPEADNSSYGYAELELYRIRTCLFPGEDP